MPSFAKPLLERGADPDPLAQFASWFAAAVGADIRQPEAAAVATADGAGTPSARMVLVKGWDERGFTFFTNYDSRKGRELAANPHAALLFYWDPLGRQVRIEGPVQRVSARESAQYVRSRPRGSQISALASPQSELIESRNWLERRVAEVAAAASDRDPPIPDDWGGFRLAPDSYEFWQHREDRLHDRLRYKPAADGGGWRIERLAP